MGDWLELIASRKSASWEDLEHVCEFSVLDQINDNISDYSKLYVDTRSRRYQENKWV